MGLFKSFFYGFKDLFLPRILFFLILTPIFVVVLWIIIFLFFGWDWIQWLADFFSNSMLFKWFMGVIGIETLGYLPVILAGILVALLFLPLSYFTIGLILSIIGMGIIVKAVHQKYYSHLILIKPSLWRSFLNTIWHSFIFLFMFILTFPLWLLPGMQIFLPILLMGNYNRAVFSYDALSEFLTHEQIKQFQKEHKGDLILLGVLIGAIAYIPLAFLIMPIVGAIAFTHYSLSRLPKNYNGN